MSTTYPVQTFLAWAAKRGDNRIKAIRKGCSQLSGSPRTIDETTARSWADCYDVEVEDIWSDAIAPAGDGPTECDVPGCHKPVNGVHGLGVHKAHSHGIRGATKASGAPASYGRASRTKVFGVDGVCALLEAERDKLRAKPSVLEAERENLAAEVVRIEKAYKVLRETAECP